MVRGLDLMIDRPQVAPPEEQTPPPPNIYGGVVQGLTKRNWTNYIACQLHSSI